MSSQIFQFVFDSNVKILEDHHHLDRIRGLIRIFWNIKKINPWFSDNCKTVSWTYVHVTMLKLSKAFIHEHTASLDLKHLYYLF